MISDNGNIRKDVNISEDVQGGGGCFNKRSKNKSEDRAEVGRLLGCKIGTDYGILPESRCG